MFVKTGKSFALQTDLKRHKARGRGGGGGGGREVKALL